MEVMGVEEDRTVFAGFVADVEPRLRRALTLLRGPDAGRDAVAEALAWAWENWAAVQAMANPAGYLYRVGISRTRRKPGAFQVGTGPSETHDFEPALAPALGRLSQRQRTVVVLIHGCGWTHQEVADALDLTRSSIGSHLNRAMSQLRHELGVDENG